MLCTWLNKRYSQWNHIGSSSWRFSFQTRHNSLTIFEICSLFHLWLCICSAALFGMKWTEKKVYLDSMQGVICWVHPRMSWSGLFITENMSLILKVLGLLMDKRTRPNPLQFGPGYLLILQYMSIWCGSRRGCLVYWPIPTHAREQNILWRSSTAKLVTLAPLEERNMFLWGLHSWSICSALGLKCVYSWNIYPFPHHIFMKEILCLGLICVCTTLCQQTFTRTYYNDVLKSQ